MVDAVLCVHTARRMRRAACPVRSGPPAVRNGIPSLHTRSNLDIVEFRRQPELLVQLTVGNGELTAAPGLDR